MANIIHRFEDNRLTRKTPWVILLVSLALMLAVIDVLAAVTLADVNPNTSTVSQDRNATSGGRVNGLSVAANNDQLVFAASEWGGIYRSMDGGTTWVHLDNHLPQATWDVLVDPSNTNRVYATSFFDGRVNSLAGINVSTDGGNTWTHPAIPDTNPQCPTARFTQPSAWGITVRPDDASDVFAGTNCGLARSTDSGATWTHVDPDPNAAREIYDVAAQAGGIIDVCGADGHHRSTDNGVTWSLVNANSPIGFCSIAVSPLEPNVIFMTAGGSLWESANAGQTWTRLDEGIGGRIPFVVTNQLTATTFHLYLGLGRDVFRQINCDNDAANPPRCPQGNTANNAVDIGTDITGNAHADSGDLEFNPTQAVPRCPLYYSNDGGIYRNGNVGDPGCQTPNWLRAMNGLHATWLFDLDGTSLAGPNTGVYFGLQDDGFWGSANAAASWANPDCCDVFDVTAETTQVVYSVCCFTAQPATRLFSRPANNPGGSATTIFGSGDLPPSGWLFEFNQEDSIVNYGANTYVLVTSTTNRLDATGTNGNGQVWVTTDNFATFTQLGTAPAGACGVQVGLNGGTPTFYVLTGACNGFGGTLWSYTGAAAGGTWTRADTGLTSVGVYAVDFSNPNRLYASDLAAGGPRMVFSTDGGATWNPDTELDGMMTGGGLFLYQTNGGPTAFLTSNFTGYPQPSMLAFNPANGNMIAAGGQDSGVFLSLDGGTNWGLLTDPLTPGATGVPHLPRPYHAYFDNNTPGTTNLYVGTVGRGVWRFAIRPPTANAGGPYTTNEGTDVALDGTASSDPDGAALTFAWDLDNDGDYDDATGPTPDFDRVGQDGVFTIGLKVSAGGLTDTDQTTVNVNNVSPTVALNSDSPVNEGAPVTVSGVVTDPGWLDLLTATVDWGDGTPVEPITGVLEKNRPNATLTFSVSHIYGDNATPTANICGSDDDSTVCQTIGIQVNNVDPSAVIDESTAILINGIPTFLAAVGEPVEFRGRSIDPGSDDLTLSWDWDDGPPAPDVTTLYLVNPPNPDPFPSTSVQPRDITDIQMHTFADACLYQISYLAADDDGGTAFDQAMVIIVGNAERTRHEGYWQTEFGRKGNIDFDDATLDCYLNIIAYVSTVFNEDRDASTIPAAFDVLFLKQNGGSAVEQLDRELLTVWLNFANGALAYNQLVDTDKNGIADTPLSEVVTAAEAVRLNPTVTEKELMDQTQILHQLNNLWTK